MRLMNWNIEWMNNWFVGNGQVAWRNTHTGIADVQALADRVANVITAVDPDVLTIQEGPSDPREMELFITDCLSAPNGQPLYDAFGGLDGGAQKLYTLVKRGGQFINPRLASDAPTDHLLDEWMTDVDGDARLESYTFTRDPLIIDGEFGANNETLRILTLHTKSKFVNQQEAMWRDLNRRQDFIVAALRNRRRISAEAMHTRVCLDDLYDVDPGTLVVVTGDFNDGPGLDYFEQNYLTHGVTDILMGSCYHPDRQYEHALIGHIPQNQLFTARFDDFIDDIDDRPLLLDHILASPALRGRHANPQVAHTAYEAQIDATRPEDARDRLPSDHRPVVVELN